MHIRERKMPLVTISLPYSAGLNSVAIHTDNKAIAKEAARMLMSARTFNSYAYYPTVDSAEWSIEREEHFLKYVNQQKKVHPAVTLPRSSTAEALLALPRPVGILAANDTYAAELLDICSKTKLRIPKDVSIIGVDNEEFLCESSTPSLTSIEPDFEYEGYVAAKSLIELLNKENTPAKLSAASGEQWSENRQLTKTMLLRLSIAPLSTSMKRQHPHHRDRCLHLPQGLATAVGTPVS